MYNTNLTSTCTQFTLNPPPVWTWTCPNCGTQFTYSSYIPIPTCAHCYARNQQIYQSQLNQPKENTPKMKLFEYVIYCDEYYNEDEDCTIPAEILVDPTLVLAADLDRAKRKAAKTIPDEYDDNDNVVIIVKEYN